MAKTNEIEIEILPGGFVKITSGKVEMKIHAKIEVAMKTFLDSIGNGKVKTTHLPHHHRDTGSHVHGEHGHQH